MTATVHQIGEARKRRSEAGEVMHFASGPAEGGCPQCAVCEICGDTACNSAKYREHADFHGDDAHIWTSDMGIWAKHSHPCKEMPLLGASGDTPPDGPVHQDPST